jgi:hypothetical protein
MSLGPRSLVALLVVSFVLMVAGASSAQPPVARSAGSTCGVGSGHGYGYTYLTFLWVYRTSCSTGKHVANHHGHVRGWRCAKKRLATSPVQYQERETCKRGRAEVQWTYTQNT